MSAGSHPWRCRALAGLAGVAVVVACGGPNAHRPSATLPTAATPAIETTLAPGVPTAPAPLSAPDLDGRLAQPVSICVLAVADAMESVARLRRALAAEAELRLVPGVVADCDVVVLPSAWGQHAWWEIAERRDEIRAFVAAGGALLIFQPNPFAPGRRSDRFDVLAASFTVDSVYVDKTVAAVADHPLLRGLAVAELPYTADRVTAADPPWVPLVRGQPSGHASLLIAELGCGRAAIDADNPTSDDPRRHPTHSDRFLARLVRWLVSGEEFASCQ